MKGIILASGRGRGLCPATMHVPKTLLPAYDKPVIYYPLSTLMSAGITEILVVTDKEDKQYYKRLLDDGKQFGVSIKYAYPKGRRDAVGALLAGRKFAGKDSVALALGDNVFYGEEIYELMVQAMSVSQGATVFCKSAKDSAHLTASVDADGRVTSVGRDTGSDLAVTGLFFFDRQVFEMTDGKDLEGILSAYAEKGLLGAKVLGDGSLWGDADSFDSLLDISNRIQDIERTGRALVCSPEEVAFTRGYITKRQLLQWVSKFESNLYFGYLRSLAEKDGQ